MATVLITSKIFIFFCFMMQGIFGLIVLNYYCYCIICLITILKVFNKKKSGTLQSYLYTERALRSKLSFRHQIPPKEEGFQIFYALISSWGSILLEYYLITFHVFRSSRVNTKQMQPQLTHHKIRFSDEYFTLVIPTASFCSI